MNIRLPNSLQTFPGTVTALPGQIQRADSRTRLILGILAVVIGVALVWYVSAGCSHACTAGACKQAPAVLVRMSQVARRKTIVTNERTIGTVIANATVQVTARVGGQLDPRPSSRRATSSIRATCSSSLDPRPFKAALDAGQAANMARDQATPRQRPEGRQALFGAGDIRRGFCTAGRSGGGNSARMAGDREVRSGRWSMLPALNLHLHQNPFAGGPARPAPILVQPGNLMTADGTTPLVTITQVQPVKISFFAAADRSRRAIQDASWPLLSIIITVHGPRRDGKHDHRAGRFRRQPGAPTAPAPSNCAAPSPISTTPWCRASSSMSAWRWARSTMPRSCRMTPSISAPRRTSSMSWTPSTMRGWCPSPSTLNDDGTRDGDQGQREARRHGDHRRPAPPVARLHGRDPEGWPKARHQATQGRGAAAHARNEHLRSLHQEAGHDDAAHGGAADLRHIRLLDASRQRTSERRFPHHPGVREPSGRGS